MTLRELREQLGVPKADAARQLGMSDAALDGLEAVSVADASGNTLSLFVLARGGRLEAVVRAQDGTERRAAL